MKNISIQSFNLTGIHLFKNVDMWKAQATYEAVDNGGASVYQKTIEIPIDSDVLKALLKMTDEVMIKVDNHEGV